MNAFLEIMKISENVEVTKRNNPKHSRRNGFPGADSVLQRSTTRYDLEQPDRRRPSRSCWSVQSYWSRHSQSWHAHNDFPAWRRIGADSARKKKAIRLILTIFEIDDLQIRRWRSRNGNVQHRQVDPRFRSKLHDLRRWSRMATLSLDQEHHSQKIRWPIQGFS